ncbi:hypothetical protein H206_00833 [Candidatus Electrothrix aarhusensis]|uniref:Peptidase C-terminal archaeal/bacterial domain-containing protein n=1 Tax=Candidatus Electrothrix aarhusensis TaxID=1859131 RepID=A0A444IX85_9BACT|nr:hypothetical protein H206_00833 [Candidatus Electrothrix aarhusensis]
MWVMKKGNIIYKVGLLFVFVGVMLPSTASAMIPTVCGEIPPDDLTDQEETLVDGQYFENPSPCYSFTVGQVPVSLHVALNYIHNDTHNLDMNLWDSSNKIIKRGADAIGNQGEEAHIYDAVASNATYYVQIVGLNDMIGYLYQFKWDDLDDPTDPPTISENSENPEDDGLPFAPGEFGQLLSVDVTDADSCIIYYGTDTNNVTASEDITIDPGTTTCKATVAYGAI